MNPCPSPSPKHGKMPVRVTALVFDLCVLYTCTIADDVPYSSLSTKISGKEGDLTSNQIVSVWLHPYHPPPPQ